MTICVAVKVHDCLVFAADSASSIVYQHNGGTQIGRVYSHGNKVFNLVRGLPLCAMTSGLGNIGPASISSVAKDLRRLFEDNSASEWYINPKSYTMTEVAEKVRKYLFDIRMPAAGVAMNNTTSLQFWIGGYGSEDDLPEIWQVLADGGVCDPPNCSMSGDISGWQCSGQPEALNRLLLGYSQRLPDLMAANGVSDDVTTTILTALGGDPATQIVEPSMPTQDAIALTRFLAETVKGYVRFLPGPDTVGGDTDIAVVTKHEGFKWIDRKHYYTPALNMETDHA